MKIIIDAMGGDNAPEAIVSGACRAARELGCEIILVGRETEIKPLIGDGENVEIVDAPDVVSMDDAYAMSVINKKDSSMMRALSLLKEGKGDAVISAGSTGALLTGALLVVKRIKGIKRAALCTTFPGKNGRFMLLDSGANTECTPEILVQFALMGHCYASSQLSVAGMPRIALLNNGTEEGKGTPALRETHKLLKELGEKGTINFVGNIEGRDIFSGLADVIVCDGFSGNIALKTVEGTAAFIMSGLKNIFYKNAVSKFAALLVKPGLKEFKKSMDYKEVGGVPFLGTAGVIIKAHGSSDEKAVFNAVKQAVSCVESGIVAEIEKNLAAISEE